MTGIHETYMQRCLELAKQGAGNVAPNPMVGAVLVCNDLIIGEGFHRQYGQAHAEVNCINSVSAEHLHEISSSTLYVSLEPCAHFGKTPPCSRLIIEKKIPRVVIGCRDPFEEVNGKGIEQLRQAGIELEVGVLEQECKTLNKRFFTFHEKQRPYIILKWAQTADRKIGALSGPRVLISNEYSNRKVHQWRSEEAAILVGTRTALLDDPALSTRLWKGNNPVRMVIDKSLELPSSLRLFDGTQPTIVFNTLKQEQQGLLCYQRMEEGNDVLQQVLKTAYEQNLQSILVEGGARLLQSFINAGYWDEARVITSQDLRLSVGVDAPVLTDMMMTDEERVLSDIITYYHHSGKKQS